MSLLLTTRSSHCRCSLGQVWIVLGRTMPHSTLDASLRPALRQHASTGSINSQPKVTSVKGSATPSRRGRIAKLDSFYQSRVSSRAISTDRFACASGPVPNRNSFRAANIRRWDGTRRTTVSWDGVRRVCCIQDICHLEGV